MGPVCARKSNQVIATAQQELFEKIAPYVAAPKNADGHFVCDTVEARFPAPALFGTTPTEKAHIASWHWRAEFEGLLAIAEELRGGQSEACCIGVAAAAIARRDERYVERGAL